MCTYSLSLSLSLYIYIHLYVYMHNVKQCQTNQKVYRHVAISDYAVLGFETIFRLLVEGDAVPSTPTGNRVEG